MSSNRRKAPPQSRPPVRKSVAMFHFSSVFASAVALRQNTGDGPGARAESSVVAERIILRDKSGDGGSSSDPGGGLIHDIGALLPRHAQYRSNRLALAVGDQRLT